MPWHHPARAVSVLLPLIPGTLLASQTPVSLASDAVTLARCIRKHEHSYNPYPQLEYRFLRRIDFKIPARWLEHTVDGLTLRLPRGVVLRGQVEEWTNMITVRPLEVTWTGWGLSLANPSFRDQWGSEHKNVYGEMSTNGRTSGSLARFDCSLFFPIVDATGDAS